MCRQALGVFARERSLGIFFSLLLLIKYMRQSAHAVLRAGDGRRGAARVGVDRAAMVECTAVAHTPISLVCWCYHSATVCRARTHPGLPLLLGVYLSHPGDRDSIPPWDYFSDLVISPNKGGQSHTTTMVGGFEKGARRDLSPVWVGVCYLVSRCRVELSGRDLKRRMLVEAPAVAARQVQSVNVGYNKSSPRR